jgi:hypothetical protein
MGLEDDEVESHVSPGKVGELELDVVGLERGDKVNEAWAPVSAQVGISHVKDLLTKDVEDKADEAVVSRQWQQNLVNEDNVLEVVDDALAVEKIHGGAEPVPVKALGGAQVSGAAGDVGNSNDLLEGDDLNGGDNEDDVDVTHEKSGEEQGDHDEGPEGTRVEVGLFLLVLSRLLLVGRGLLFARLV